MGVSPCVTVHMCMYGVVMLIQPKPGAIYGFCKAQDISRDELARRMKVTPQTAYRVDSGRVLPSPSFIAALMLVTGQKFEELFDLVEDAA